MVGTSVIVSLNDTQTIYPKVAGVRHITSSEAARVSVIVESPSQRYSVILIEVMFVIYLSHILCLVSSSTC